MIGGLLIDLLVLAAIAAFAWAGLQLGAVRSLGRAVASLTAFALAALLRDPAGAMIRSIIGTSEDFSRLVGMVAVGVGSYFATSRLFDWARARRGAVDGGTAEDRTLDSDAVAIASGGVLGLAWALLFVAMLVLLPASNLVSRAAIRSFTGGVLIRQEAALRWLDDGFPHYTQALPKGKQGAVVGEAASLPMRGEAEPRTVTEDVEVVLKSVNRVRRVRSVRALTFNPDLAAVARRHANALATDRSLSYTTPGGGTLDAQVRAALGESSGAFADEVGIEVAWAHTAANAAQAMQQDERGGALLRDPRWSEVGIGVADAGWFNGRVYVVLLVGPADEAAEDASADGGGTSTLPEEPPEGGAASDPFTGEGIELDGTAM